MGEPHWHQTEVTELVSAGEFGRVLGSLHCLRNGTFASEMPNMFRQHSASDVVRDYLGEVVRRVQGSSDFEVLGHIDYVLRYWPEAAGAFAIGDYEEEFRYALRTLAETDRVLEINTRAGLRPELVRWWRDEGGTSLALGSDAHSARGLAGDFDEAAAVVGSFGFRPSSGRDGYWRVARA